MTDGSMKPTHPILRVSSISQVPGHTMYAEWALPGREYSYIALLDLANKYLHGKRPVELAFDDICAKPGDWFGGDDFSGPRFEAAETKYPGIVIRNMPNPCDRLYRMVDGRRRMEKLRRGGASMGQFFVFEYAECEEFIFDFLIENNT